MKGIYKITNFINGKVYVGSSNDVSRRFYWHRSVLCHGNHDNKHLQNSWNRYGEDKFIFEVLLLCEDFELEYYEQWFLDNVVRWGYDYNISEQIGAPMRGRKHSEEAKSKMSVAHIGKSGYWGGKVRPSPTKETRDRMSKAHTGKLISDEHKLKLSMLRRGEGNYFSKLIKERVLMIRRMHLTEKYTQETLGKIFSVSRVTINNIVNRKSWKHI